MGFWSPLHDVHFDDLIMVISNEKARNLCLFVIRISRELFIRSTSQLAGLLPRTRGSAASNLVHVTPIASRDTMLTSAALEHLYHWVVWSSLESNNVIIHILNCKYQMCLIPSAGLDVSGSAVPTWSSAQRSAMFVVRVVLSAVAPKKRNKMAMTIMPNGPRNQWLTSQLGHTRSSDTAAIRLELKQRCFFWMLMN